MHLALPRRPAYLGGTQKKNATPLPPPQRDKMEVPIPAPSTGLLGPPAPSAVLPPFACLCPPYSRRCGLRSCCLGGDQDGNATVQSIKSPAAFFSFSLGLVLHIIITVSRCLDKYLPHSTGHHPPGPHTCKKWPIWALGSPRPNSSAFRRAPRAASPPGKGWSWPTSSRGLQHALGSPLPAHSRALAHHLGMSRPRAWLAHRHTRPLRPR